MTLFALVLILGAAFCHASWNLLAKRAGDGGAVFVWLCASFAVLLYSPAALVVLLIQKPHVGSGELLFVFGSGVLHLCYFVLLQRGYAVGDLSLVYPLARGTGPMIATAAAIAFFGERPGPLALCGVLLIAGGVFLLTREPGRFGLSVKDLGWGTAYGLLTGMFIAAYTLWDKQAVSVVMIPPLLLDWSANVVRALLLTPVAVRRRKQAGEIWGYHKLNVLGVAVLSPLSYILVLSALVFTPVSYVAPAREISILIGVVMGARLLSEGDARRRILAASAMVLGVAALALG